MKISLALLLSMFFFCNIYSQKVIHKNSYNLSGGISFAFSSNDHPDYSSESIMVLLNPSFTFHISDLLALGGGILVDYVEEKIERNTETHNSITRKIEIGPKARYYLHANNLAPFVDFSLNYSHVLPTKTNGISYSIGIGVNYFISKSVALEPKLSVRASSYFNPDYNSKTFMIGLGINYHITD